MREVVYKHRYSSKPILEICIILYKEEPTSYTLSIEQICSNKFLFKKACDNKI